MPNDPGEQEISKTERNPEYAADFESLATSLTSTLLDPEFRNAPS